MNLYIEWGSNDKNFFIMLYKIGSTKKRVPILHEVGH